MHKISTCQKRKIIEINIWLEKNFYIDKLILFIKCINMINIRFLGIISKNDNCN